MSEVWTFRRWLAWAVTRRDYEGNKTLQVLAKSLLGERPHLFTSRAHYELARALLKRRLYSWSVTESYVVIEVLAGDKYLFGLNEDGTAFVRYMHGLALPKTDEEVRDALRYDVDVVDPVVTPRSGVTYRVQGDVVVRYTTEVETFLYRMLELEFYNLVLASIQNALINFMARHGITCEPIRREGAGGVVWGVEVPAITNQRNYNVLGLLCEQFKQELRVAGVGAVTCRVRPGFNVYTVMVELAEWGDGLVKLFDKLVEKAKDAPPSSYQLTLGRHRIRCVDCYPRRVTLTFKSPLLDILNGLDGEEYSISISPWNWGRLILVREGSRLIFEHPEHKTKTLVFKEEGAVTVNTLRNPLLFTSSLNYYALKALRHLLAP